MKRATILLMLGLFSIAMLSGCNTVKGAGKDIKGAGDKIEDSAKK
jgi:predicted small secreted protein